jgi:hypothetical protein
MDGFGVGYKLLTFSQGDAESLGDPVKRLLVDGHLADDVAAARRYMISFETQAPEPRRYVH